MCVSVYPSVTSISRKWEKLFTICFLYGPPLCMRLMHGQLWSDLSTYRTPTVVFSTKEGGRGEERRKWERSFKTLYVAPLATLTSGSIGKALDLQTRGRGFDPHTRKDLLPLLNSDDKCVSLQSDYRNSKIFQSEWHFSLPSVLFWFLGRKNKESKRLEIREDIGKEWKIAHLLKRSYGNTEQFFSA